MSADCCRRLLLLRGNDCLGIKGGNYTVIDGTLKPAKRTLKVERLKIR